MNLMILIGNVGGDPEVKSFANGGRVASWSLATSERWTDKASGERREATTWHRIVTTDDLLIDRVLPWVRKGGKIAVMGKVRVRKWMDTSGHEREAREVEVRGPGAIELLGGGDGEATRSAPRVGGFAGEGHQAAIGGAALHGHARPATAPMADDFGDDEVPF